MLLSWAQLRSIPAHCFDFRSSSFPALVQSESSKQSAGSCFLWGCLCPEERVTGTELSGEKEVKTSLKLTKRPEILSYYIPDLTCHHTSYVFCFPMQVKMNYVTRSFQLYVLLSLSGSVCQKLTCFS